MVSDMAMADIRELKADGLEPTPEDIIRLNALALIFERKRSRDVMKCTSFLPRVVLLSDDLYLREPAIGHEIWLDAVSRHADRFDVDTLLSLRAFALSRDVDSLPDPNVIASVRKELAVFVRSVRRLSRQQIYAAVEFALHGFDECAFEFGRKKRRENAAKKAELGLFDMDECLSLGVLNEGRVALWGVTAAELRQLRRREVLELMDRARVWHKFPLESKPGMEALGSYNSALDEIRERLENEKEAVNG